MKVLIGIAVIALVAFTGFEVAGEHNKNIAPSKAPSPSLSKADSIWVIVNKNRPLNPKTYTPQKLVVPNVQLRENITSEEELVSSVIKTPLEQMVAAAKKDDLTLNLQSGYRSYDFQVRLYDGYVESQGQTTADKYSAKPGYSEHQTGLAVDLGGTTDPSCDVTDCFVDTPEATWIAKHAHEYGFIVRYAKGKQAITGYAYEPWHLRYVGKSLAQKVYDQNNITLEEYFKLNKK